MHLPPPLFDPEREPVADVRAAFERAVLDQKNVLLELGGDWCIWCHRLERFIRSHPELLYLRSFGFVHVKVHVEQDETDNDFIQRLPGFDGIPHFFVYQATGELLHSQDTELLEEGESYNYEKVWTFLATWGHATTGLH